MSVEVEGSVAYGMDVNMGLHANMLQEDSIADPGVEEPADIDGTEYFDMVSWMFRSCSPGLEDDEDSFDAASAAAESLMKMTPDDYTGYRDLELDANLPETPPPSPSFSPCPVPEQEAYPAKKTRKALLVPFIAECIHDSAYNPAIIKWLNKEEGVFLIVNPKEIARLWGERKGNPKMNYPSMSRGIRERRKYGYFERVPHNSKYPKKLTYKWGPKSEKYWKPFLSS